MKFELNPKFLALSMSLMIGAIFSFSNDGLHAHTDIVGPPPVTTVRQIIEFGSNELPGDVLIGLKRDLYVGFPFLHQVRRYGVRGDLLWTTTLPVPSGCLVAGLAIKWNEDIFCVVNAYFTEDRDAHGIWKISHKGERVKKFANLPLNSFPSSLVFDKSDHLYLSDSVQGKIWKIDRKGNVSTWISDPLLQGNPEGLYIPGLPQGANGITMGKKSKHLYVGNTDYGRIIKIKINKNGSAGNARIVTEGDSLIGVGGISLNRRGILYAAIPYQNAIQSIHKGGIIEEVIAGDPLEFPGDIAMKKHKGLNIGFFSNTALIDGDNPGIFRIKVACDPLHAD